MRSLRLLCAIVFLFGTFVLSQSTSLTDSLASQRQSSTLSKASPDVQKAPFHFQKAAVYETAEYEAAAVAVGDVNGDGHPDLVVVDRCASRNTCNEGGFVVVLLGNGDGTFQSPAVYYLGGLSANSVAIGDVNGDSHPDLVVTLACQNYFNGDCTGQAGPGGVSVLLGNGDGTFQAPVSYNSGALGADSVAIADVNGDGHPDLVVANACTALDPNGYCTGDAAVTVLRNNGDGTFQAPVSYDSGGTFAVSVAVADLNRDGKLDLVVVNESTDTVDVLLGNGNGTFQSPVSYSSGGYIDPTAVAIADVNGDGKPDLLVTTVLGVNDDGAVSVLLSNGDGTFQTPVSYDSGGAWAESVAVADVNGDGHPDLVVANYCHKYTGGCRGVGEVGVLAGNGDGAFQAAVHYPSGGTGGTSVAIADVNGDGRPDLLATSDCPTGPCITGVVGVLLNNLSVGTTTKVKSSPNPSKVNQSVTFTATIKSSSSVPNGSTIAFYNGATKLGTGITTNGIASLTTSFSTAGKYTIEASYPGDAFHTASSGTVNQVVN